MVTNRFEADNKEHGHSVYRAERLGPMEEVSLGEGRKTPRSSGGYKGVFSP